MRTLCFVLLVCALCSACGKKKNDAKPAAGAQQVEAEKPLTGTVDPQMTAVLKQFVQEKGRLPQSFLELASSKLDSVPKAPRGYMYAIDPATTEVKLVKP